MTRTSSSKINDRKEVQLTKIELKKLKSLLPTLQQKTKSSPIEIVMETIHYIRELEDQLMDRYQMDFSHHSTSTDSSLSSTPFQEIGNQHSP